MSRTTLSISAAALVAAAFLGANDAKAVRLDPEAGGQALIYPYYTVRSRGTDPFNTYLSIVNTSADGKALRVRFREGRQGLETLGFNLFLSPNDTWTGALVPSADGGTQLVTTDRSCATYAAPFDASGMNREPLSAASFAADGPDRTREGYVEVLEMGTVKGATLAAITQDAGGTPHDCGFVQSRLVDRADIAAPSGGLQGTLTLINVASGDGNSAANVDLNVLQLAQMAAQVANGSIPTAPYNECHWPPKSGSGSDFVSLYNQALAEPDETKRTDIIHTMYNEEFTNGGYIIPFFNNLVDAYSSKISGFQVNRGTLNLDTFGHGYRTIWFNA